MNLNKTFFSFEEKSSGFVYAIRYIIITFGFLIPTSVVVMTSMDIYDGTESLSAIRIVFPIVIFLFIVQDKQRLNSLISKKNIRNLLFYILILSYLINCLSLWDERFSFEGSGFFNTCLNLYLIFWSAKYKSEDDKKLASRIFIKKS